MADAQYFPLEKCINLHDGYRRCFHIDALHLLLLQEAGEVYLIQAHCPHKGYALEKADVVEGRITCPLHHFKFSLKTGDLLAPESPATPGLRHYPVAWQGNEVGVYLSETR